MSKKKPKTAETVGEIVIFLAVLLLASMAVGYGFTFFDDDRCYTPVRIDGELLRNSDADIVQFAYKCR